MKMFTDKDLAMFYKYSKTHTVEKKKGTEVDLRNLEANQSVVWGDGETYHYLLTNK